MKKYDISQGFTIPKGVYKLNPERNFDYQLNRLINWDGGRLEDVQKIADKIHTSDDWKKYLIQLGDEALREERFGNAIAYYRMSEFFMFDGDPDKLKYYRLATKLFYAYYQDYFRVTDVSGGKYPFIEKISVTVSTEYGKLMKLPVMHVRPMDENGRILGGIHEGEPGKDVILLHGGNDSYFEEFLFSLLYLQKQGYEVYCFEGPGQGGVIREQGIHFTHQWERPVTALLNALKLDDVTIIGVSLGGYLAPRAAAFDKRIKRVVAWSIFPCFYDTMLANQAAPVRCATELLMNLHARPVINFAYGKIAEKMPVVDWGLKHGCYAYEAEDAYDYARKLKLYDISPVAERITQDMLIIGANADHFIPYRIVGNEISLLKNVKSLTFRLFTEQEQAGNHCNVGNGKLALDNILNWIALTKRND